MLKKRKWFMVLALILLVGSVCAVDKGIPYEDGKDDDDTFGVEVSLPSYIE